MSERDRPIRLAAFQGTDPGNHDNTALRQAFEDQPWGTLLDT